MANNPLEGWGTCTAPWYDEILWWGVVAVASVPVGFVIWLIFS